MRFLLDAHMPPALAVAIRAAGHSCDEVRKLIPADSLDLEIAYLANRLDAIVISKDVDFVDLLQRDVLQTALVRVRFPNMMANETVAAMLPRLPQIVSAIESGETLIEIR